MVKEATKLSEKQVTQTLGSIDKKRRVKIFRNSLLFPYVKTWPVVNSADAIEVINILEKLLPKAKIHAEKPLWKDLCKLSKEERKKLKEVQAKKEELNLFRPLLSAGYSAVTRGLERKEICCCILAKDVEPNLMRNIVSLAQNKKVPALIIPDLKAVLKKTINFTAMAIGFKLTVVEPNCLFNPIYKCILELSKKFPASEELSKETHNLKIQPSSLETNQRINNKINFHLFKPSTNGLRAFVPPREKPDNCVHVADSMAFIPIDIDHSETDVKLSTKTQFKCTMKDVKENDNSMDSDCDDGSMHSDCDELFQFDTKPDNLLKTSWEQSNVDPVKKRKIHINPVYQSTKIKTIRSNPVKALNKKKKRT